MTFKEELNASKISSLDNEIFSLLKDVSSSYYDAIYVPFLTIGGTDCCFYNELCSSCYRFAPRGEDFSLTSGVGIVHVFISVCLIFDKGKRIYFDFECPAGKQGCQV